MKVLKNILLESEQFYFQSKKKIEKALSRIPRGNIKARVISSRKYFYLQKREGGKVIHQYLGKNKPEDLQGLIKKRPALKAELKKIKEALKILKRAKGRKRA